MQDERRPAVVGRWLEGFCLVLAIAGGVLLSALALMTVVSITGRWLSGTSWAASLALLEAVGPVTGDFEMIEMGTAIAVFLFLPYCHLKGGHVTVDLVVMHAPRMVQHALAFLSECLFLGFAGLMAWQAVLGTLDKWQYQQTTMLLGLPVWWGYAFGVVGLALLAVVCLYRAVGAVWYRQGAIQ